MTTPGPPNTSGTARLMVDAPSFAVGWQQPIYVPNPAPGVSWSHQCDGRYYERVLAMISTLTTSAAVGSRFPVFQLNDANGAEICTVPAGGGVVASSSLITSLTVNAPSYAAGPSGNTNGFMPDIMMPPGWTWKMIVFGIDVADQLSNVVLLVQQFPNDAAEISAVG